MMSNPSFTRPHPAELLRRLQEPRRFLQVVTGARQVGKTTMVNQVAAPSGLPYRYLSAHEPTLQQIDINSTSKTSLYRTSDFYEVQIHHGVFIDAIKDIYAKKVGLDRSLRTRCSD